MKKFLSTIFLAAVCSTCFAQLKVNSAGKVAIGTLTPSSNIRLAVGNNCYFTQGGINNKIGTAATPYLADNYHNIGVEGYVNANQSFTSERNFGVLGITSVNVSHGRNYGVAGMLHIDPQHDYGGAGVYAADYQFLFMYPDNIQGTYAAYIHGTTNLQGRTTAQEIYTPADDRLSEDVEFVETRNGGEGQTLANLLRMNVREFNLKNAQSVEAPDAKEMTDEVRQAYEYMQKEETEIYSRRHFGLSAQELQKIYPDLVLKGQDGYLYVNYTELVPLLIQSIQELKAELDEVKEKDGTARKTRSSETATNAEAEEADILAMSQNVPNPFTESTEIQLNIPQSVKTAAVFFYDMTGKQVDKRIITERGATTLSVSGTDLTEGMYLYSLIADGKMISTKKMILTK